MTEFDPKQTKDAIVQWIRDYFAENGPDCSAVVGISGGKDSSIVAALCVEALGKDRVFGVLMPDGEQADIMDAFALCDALDIRKAVINIGNAKQALLDSMPCPYQWSQQAMVNMPPRLRMATLYAMAQSLPEGGRVANTCNLSEDYVGYSTKFGDSAGDFSPLGRLTVTQARQIGHLLPIPVHLVDKTPSDGLCGKTDEDMDILLLETGLCFRPCHQRSGILHPAVFPEVHLPSEPAVHAHRSDSVCQCVHL